MRKPINILAAIFLVLFLCGTVYATPVQWSIADGGNDHWYEIIATPETNWEATRAAAEAKNDMGLNWTLATITSQGENDFIAGLLNPVVKRYWLGGIQNPNQQAGEQWSWVTGEAWGYENWQTGTWNDEPDNDDPNEYIHLGISYYEKKTGAELWGWADLTDKGRSYIVEGAAAPVPEPATMLLLGTGLVGLAGVGRKKLKMKK